MANGQALVYAKKPDPGALAIAGLVGLGGIGLVILLSRGGNRTGPVNTACLTAGEQLSHPAAPNLEEPGTFEVPLGTPVDVLSPTIYYSGPGRDAYSAARIVQDQGGSLVTVYGSGIAGTHLMAAASPELNLLVPPNQPQPPGAPTSSLRMFPWPGPGPTVNYICGAPAKPGPATIVLEVYGRCTPADADGYSSTTCNNRRPVAKKEYANKVMFV